MVFPLKGDMRESRRGRRDFVCWIKEKKEGFKKGEDRKDLFSLLDGGTSFRVFGFIFVLMERNRSCIG